jgi:hypothetical protein
MDDAAGDLAELARTTIHAARFGTLSTYPRLAPHRAHITTVHVVPLEGGSLLAYLLPRAPGALMLLQRPLATVRVAPAGHQTVTVHGHARRRPDADTGQLHAFEVNLGAVRVGDAAEQSVDTVRYTEAQPDQVRAQAPALLEHLNLGHRPNSPRACAAAASTPRRQRRQRWTVTASSPSVSVPPASVRCACPSPHP